ncbi:JAB domain-containing protein [Allopusillimonas soli]|uniref:DNA repair protein RadC n=1 Tax=Allopusillimonas soli TaxID=659016 RepID=A0A853F710_9BURK|nr:DNA repair protein RadC [Allopusillimonas soli]NYT35608.1 DNA repair protein RadC [Allopusillimonas soli]TEA76010.1 JAB domain-containing protein [Allopusillimonas soli]
MPASISCSPSRLSNAAPETQDAPPRGCRPRPPLKKHARQASRHIGHERPRERLLAFGPQALTTAELVAVVLRTGTRGCGALALGHMLLDRFSGLRGLLAAPADALMSSNGLGAAKACVMLAIGELNRRALEEALAAGQPLADLHQAKRYCACRLSHLTVEHCLALYLDNQLRLISAEEVSRGTLTQAAVYPREIVKAGLQHHASAVILAHNHPSGTARASEADINLTQHLKRALALVDIRLLDHLIVAGPAVVSLVEQGKL